jgi:hypothetical protein
MTADKVLERLRTDDALRREGVDVVIDRFLDTRLDELLDTAALSEIVAQAIRGPNAAWLVERHVAPGIARYRERANASHETIGDMLPMDARKKLEDVIAKIETPDGDWFRDALDRDLLRKLFAPVLQDTLLAFARRLPLLGFGSGGGKASKLAGKITKSVAERAEKIADAGKRAMGGIGREMDERLEAIAKEFSETAEENYRHALEQRVASPEGRQIVEELRRKAFRHLLGVEIGLVLNELATLPNDELAALIAPVVDHNAKRAVNQRAMRTEVAAVLAEEGSRTVREALAERGMLESVSKTLRERTDRFAAGLFATAEFERWLRRVLA